MLCLAEACTCCMFTDIYGAVDCNEHAQLMHVI